MTRPIRQGTLLVLTVVALFLTSLTTPAAAPTASATVQRAKVVVVGDSFSANPAPDSGPDCYRSPTAWPYQLKLGTKYTVRQLAKKKLISLTFLACTSATMPDLISRDQTGQGPQIPRIPTDATRIYLTIGGNDVGFSSVVYECAIRHCTKDTNAVAAAYNDLNRGILAGNLTSVLNKIRKQAPYATVYLVGYPELFNAKKCGPFIRTPKVKVGITRDEAKLMSALGLKLEKAQKSAAAKNGVRFISVRKAFHGHGDCTDGSKQWIYSMLEGKITKKRWESAKWAVHPNAEGRRQYAKIVDAKS